MAARKFETILGMLDETQLEQWVVAYINTCYQTDSPGRRYGRKGQRQQGVDVHARLTGVGDAGYQAKAYVSTRLTIAAFDEELAAAHAFQPSLQRYTVVTLNPRDAALQQHARLATIHDQRNVEVLALEDLADIAVEHDALRKLAFQMAFSAGDVEQLLAPYVVDASTLPIKVLAIEDDGALPVELRAIEGWVNAGKPRRALTELGQFTGAITQSSRCRLECRAHLALKDYAQVVQAVESEQARPAPDASVLALGAHAAEGQGDRPLADEWLTLALARATDRNRPDVVAAYLRIQSQREAANLAALEAFAAASLGDSKRVAAALGDAAAQLDDRVRALHWYEIARENKPHRPLGVEINEACSAIALVLNRLEAGTAGAPELAEPVRVLESLAVRGRDCEAPAYAFAVLNALGFGYQALGRHLEAAKVWDEALAASDDHPGLWFRRCLLSANERVPAPEVELITRHATSRLARLILASALGVTGRAEEALPWIERVLTDAEASEEERAIAHVERLRLQRGADERRPMLDETLGLLNAMPTALPLLVWAVLHFGDADEAQQVQIRAHLGALSSAALNDDRVLGLATTLVGKGLEDIAVAWLPRVAPMAFDEQGELLNHDAAELNADLCLAALQFEDAVRIRERLWRRRPSDTGAVLQYAKVLYEAGDREKAYRTMNTAIAAGATSSRLIVNWAMLAAALGHQREAHGLLRSRPVSSAASPEDYARLMQARAVLGVRGHHEEVLTGLRQGWITPENAGSVFGTGLRRRHRHEVPVAFGTIVQLRIPDAFEGTVCLVEKAAPPLPGLQTLDADHHPWIVDLLGAHTGDVVDLSCGVFQGKQATVVWVRDATGWVVHQAHELIAICAPEVTGVEPIAGPIEEQLAITKRRLQDQHNAVSETMRVATAARMPIAFLAERFKMSAREFFQAGAGWVPTAHAGTTEAIALDDAALGPNTGWVFDPVTVLLLAAIGAESLPAALPHKPGLTRHAAWQLFDWYMQEREGRRATAHLRLAEDGRLLWMDYRVRQRVALLKHWRGVSEMIQQHFEILDTPSLPNPAEMAQLVDVLGTPMLSGLLAAPQLGRVLISEEELVRGAATHVFDAKAASLHRLIAHAADQGWISRTKATVWLASLIRMGWTWVSFPVWMLDHALRLDERRRWDTASAFLGRMRTAEPINSVRVLLNVLQTADNNGYRQLDDSRLRSAVYAALPRIEQKMRVHFASRYEPSSASRKHRATRKMLARWAAGP